MPVLQSADPDVGIFHGFYFGKPRGKFDLQLSLLL
jgi:hypothetical protein